MSQTKDITAATFDNDGQGTQYSNKPLDPKEIKLVVNETVIQQVNRSPLAIQQWRTAHQAADSRYYPNRSWLYDIYDDCLLDAHLSGIIAKRIDTVLNKDISFKRNGKPDQSFEKLINSAQFRMICRIFLETQAWGISGIEFIPGKELNARPIPRKHIKTKWQIISFLQEGNEGIDYTTAKNIMVVGEPEDLGYLLKCCPYVIYKRNILGDWAKYIEIFGQPIRVMYYDAHDQQAKIELKQTLDKSGGGLALMIPNGVKFELVDGKVTNGDGKLQQNAIDTLDRQLSVAVLGNTETTTNGQTGTGAKSKVHKDQQDEISKSDIFWLKSQLNSDQFLLILQSYGYNTAGGAFDFGQEISIEYLTALMKVWVMAPEDLPIGDDDWYNTFGIPKPSNYDQLKKQLADKQRIQKEAGDIENDPLNKPSKKPANDQPTKKELKQLKAILAQYQPQQRKSKVGMIRKIINFFAQA